MARVRQYRRRRKGRARVWARRTALGLLAIPGLYLLAAFVGSLVAVNRGWTEPDQGIIIYLADNGVHADLVLPVRAGGLDWRKVLTPADVARAPDGARWVAFGAGERAVYLETPTWADLRVPTALRALTRGERIVHVEWVADPAYSARQIRLRPEEYRRLWAAVRSEFRDGRAQKIAHKGYGQADAFYLGIGKTSAFNTCNNWIASRLRLAGVEVSLWSPFTDGLVWRYRKADQST
jgi:uncharacterized protein (TIGR02117 family)